MLHLNSKLRLNQYKRCLLSICRYSFTGVMLPFRSDDSHQSGLQGDSTNARSFSTIRSENLLSRIWRNHQTQTMRTRSEWRAAFLLSADSDIILDVKVGVQSQPQKGIVTAMRCLMRIGASLSRLNLVPDDSESVNDSVSLVTGRATALVV